MNKRYYCPAGSIPYIIRQGDTLYSIAQIYGTTAERLIEVNKIKDPKNLLIGSKICIPLPVENYPSCRTTNYYVVNEDDTIYSISKYFGVSESQLLHSNMGIDPHNIYDGMILCIPVAPPPLSVSINETLLTLLFNNGETESFPCRCNSSSLSTYVVQKALDSSIGGKKILNLAQTDYAICSKSAECSQLNIILSDNDMDTVFNLVPVGTEVTII